MRAKEEAYRILEVALSIASAGVDEAEVSLLGGALGSARFAGNQLHPSSQHAHEKLTVRLSHKGRRAGVATSDLSTNGITSAAQQARAELERLPHAMRGESVPAPQTYQEVNAYDDETASLHPLERTALAARAITAAHRASVEASGVVAIARGGVSATARRDPEGGLSAGTPKVYAVANTRGLLAYHPSTWASFDLRMEVNGRSGRAHAGSFAVRELVPSELVERAVWKVLQGEQVAVLPPGRYTAVLEPEAVASLVRAIGLTAGAARMARGESFLSDRIGERVIDPRLSIIDDFRHPLLRGVPFDCDGIARQRVPIIDAGVATAPVVSWSSGLRLDRTPTGHRVDLGPGHRGEAAEHLVVSGGEADTEQLIRDTHAGVLVSDFEGVAILDHRTLRVVGSTAGGTFAIERGELTVPVSDLRFDVSILDLFSRVEGLGEARWADGSVVPPLKVAELPLYAAT